MAALLQPRGDDNAPTSIDLDGIEVPLEVRCNPRARRVSVRLDARAECIVLVLPHWRQRAEGLRFLQAKKAWVRRQWLARPARIPFVDGQRLPFLDDEIRLCHQPLARFGARRVDDVLYVAGEPAHLARRTTDWLRRQARTILQSQAVAQAARLDCRVARVAIRDTKTRWGSCSADGALSFSWRLVLAPRVVLDYVVAHEVSHLIEMNHSPRFWRLVADLHEDVDHAERWLKRHGAALHRYG